MGISEKSSCHARSASREVTRRCNFFFFFFFFFFPFRFGSIAYETRTAKLSPVTCMPRATVSHFSFHTCGRRELKDTISKGYRPQVHETSYLLAFAWLQVTRSARGPVGPRADRVTCNHAKANSNLSSAQGRYLACFTRSRYEHKMRSNLAPCFTSTFHFEDVMC